MRFLTHPEPSILRRLRIERIAKPVTQEVEAEAKVRFQADPFSGMKLVRAAKDPAFRDHHLDAIGYLHLNEVCGYVNPT